MDRAFEFGVLMVDVIFVIERDHSSHKQWTNVNNSFDLVSMICNYVIAFLITIYTYFKNPNDFRTKWRNKNKTKRKKHFNISKDESVFFFVKILQVCDNMEFRNRLSKTKRMLSPSITFYLMRILLV